MDYINVNAQPTANLVIENVTTNSFEVDWLITNFESGSDYTLFLFNTSTMLLEQEPIYITNDIGSHTYYDLVSGTTYAIMLNASFDNMYGIPTTTTISTQYATTSPKISTAAIAVTATAASFGGLTILFACLWQRTNIAKLYHRVKYMFFNNTKEFHDKPLAFEKCNSYMQRCMNYNNIHELNKLIEETKESIKYTEDSKNLEEYLKDLKQRATIIKNTCKGYMKKHFPKDKK